ncbi:DUF4350 domain-containing protein [Ornithinibacillus salinisoli]|uniref:DUF4350 domain-containing protein n=1 Tax=Ornithinibacillus salinisoli TaxID=1848459 RepID=A0ABW4VYU6_9BACI
MQKSSSSKRVWLLLLILVCIFIMISYFISSKQPQEFPSYVSDSPSPTGSKALYTYLQNETSSVVTWRHEPHLLSKENKQQILLMIEPFFIPKQEEMNVYIEFMNAGNTILLLKNNPDGMFGLKTEPIAIDPEESVTITDEQGEEYISNTYSPVRLKSDRDDDVLLSDDAGVMALKRSFGEGSLIVGSSPDWVTNEFILEKDHVEIVFSLLYGESWDTLLVDEYLHRAGQSPTLLTLYPKWLLVGVVQSILLTVLWLWHQGKRFGPIRIPREETVRFSDERLKALSAWYQRGRRHHDSLMIQVDYVKLLMQERWGIPYRKAWADRTDQLIRKRTNMTEEEIHTFVNGIRDLIQKRSINKQEYVGWSKKIDKLRKEVEKG